LKVFVKGLRPFGHELKAEWLRSPGPDPVYKLICLIQDLGFTYMLTWSLKPVAPGRARFGVRFA
jgi:hypothetical protein